MHQTPSMNTCKLISHHFINYKRRKMNINRPATLVLVVALLTLRQIQSSHQSSQLDTSKTTTSTTPEPTTTTTTSASEPTSEQQATGRPQVVTVDSTPSAFDGADEDVTPILSNDGYEINANESPSAVGSTTMSSGDVDYILASLAPTQPVVAASEATTSATTSTRDHSQVANAIEDESVSPLNDDDNTSMNHNDNDGANHRKQTMNEAELSTVEVFPSLVHEQVNRASKNSNESSQLVRSRKSPENATKVEPFQVELRPKVIQLKQANNTKQEQQLATSSFDYDDFDLDYQLKLNASELADQQQQQAAPLNKRDYDNTQAPLPPAWSALIAQQPHVFSSTATTTSSLANNETTTPVPYYHNTPPIVPSLLTVKSTQLTSQELNKIRPLLLLYQDNYNDLISQQSSSASSSIANDLANGDLLATASGANGSPQIQPSINDTVDFPSLSIHSEPPQSNRTTQVATISLVNGSPVVRTANNLLENFMQSTTNGQRHELHSPLSKFGRPSHASFDDPTTSTTTIVVDNSTPTEAPPPVESPTTASSTTTTTTTTSASITATSTEPTAVPSTTTSTQSPKSRSPTNPAAGNSSQSNQWFNYPHPNLHQNPLLLHHILNKPQSFYVGNSNNQQSSTTTAFSSDQTTTPASFMSSTTVLSPISTTGSSYLHHQQPTTTTVISSVVPSSTTVQPFSGSGGHLIGANIIERPTLSSFQVVQQPINKTLVQMQLNEMRSLAANTQQQMAVANQMANKPPVGLATSTNELLQPKPVWSQQQHQQQQQIHKAHQQPSNDYLSHLIGARMNGIPMQQRPLNHQVTQVVPASKTWWSSSVHNQPNVLHHLVGSNFNHMQASPQFPPQQVYFQAPRVGAPMQQPIKQHSLQMKPTPLASQIIAAPSLLQEVYTPRPAPAFTSATPARDLAFEQLIRQHQQMQASPNNQTVVHQAPPVENSNNNNNNNNNNLSDEDMSTYVALLASLNPQMSPSTSSPNVASASSQHQQSIQDAANLDNFNQTDLEEQQQIVALLQLLNSGNNKPTQRPQNNADHLSQQQTNWLEILKGAKLFGLSEEVQAQIYRDYLSPMMQQQQQQQQHWGPSNSSASVVGHLGASMPSQALGYWQVANGQRPVRPAGAAEGSTPLRSFAQLSSNHQVPSMSAGQKSPKDFHNYLSEGSVQQTTKYKQQASNFNNQMLLQQQQQQQQQRQKQLAFVEALRATVSKLQQFTSMEELNDHLKSLNKSGHGHSTTGYKMSLDDVYSQLMLDPGEQQLANASSLETMNDFDEQLHQNSTGIRATSTGGSPEKQEIQDSFLHESGRLLPPFRPAWMMPRPPPLFGPRPIRPVHPAGSRPPVGRLRPIYPLPSPVAPALSPSSSIHQPLYLAPQTRPHFSQLIPKGPSATLVSPMESSGSRPVPVNLMPLYSQPAPITHLPMTTSQGPQTVPSLLSSSPLQLSGVQQQQQQLVTPTKIMLDRFPLTSAPAYLVKLPTLTGGIITASGSLVSPSSRFMRTGPFGGAGRPITMLGAPGLGPLRFLNAITPPRMRLIQQPPQSHLPEAIRPAASSLFHGHHHSSPLMSASHRHHYHLQPLPTNHLYNHQHQMMPHHYHYGAPPGVRMQVYASAQQPTTVDAAMDFHPSQQQQQQVGLSTISPAQNWETQQPPAQQPAQAIVSASPSSTSDNFAQTTTTTGNPTANQATSTETGNTDSQVTTTTAASAALSRLQQATASLVELTSLASLIEEMVGGSDMEAASPAVALANAINSISAAQSAALSAQASQSQGSTAASTGSSLDQQQTINQQQQQQSPAFSWRNLFGANLWRHNQNNNGNKLTTSGSYNQAVANGAKLRDLSALERLLAHASNSRPPARLKVKYIRVPVAVYETNSGDSGLAVVPGPKNHLMTKTQLAELVANPNSGAQNIVGPAATTSESFPSQGSQVSSGSGGSTSLASNGVSGGGASTSAASATAASTNEYLFDEMSSESGPQLHYLLQHDSDLEANSNLGYLPIVRAVKPTGKQQQHQSSRMNALWRPMSSGGSHEPISSLESNAIYSMIASPSSPASMLGSDDKKSKKSRKKKKNNNNEDDDDEDEDEDDDDLLSGNDLPVLESIISALVHGSPSPMSTPGSRQVFVTAPQAPQVSSASSWRPRAFAGLRGLTSEASAPVASYAMAPSSSTSSTNLQQQFASPMGGSPMSAFGRHRLGWGEVVGALGARKLITSLLGSRERSRTSKRAASTAAPPSSSVTRSPGLVESTTMRTNRRSPLAVSGNSWPSSLANNRLLAGILSPSSGTKPTTRPARSETSTSSTVSRPVIDFPSIAAYDSYSRPTRTTRRPFGRPPARTTTKSTRLVGGSNMSAPTNENVISNHRPVDVDKELQTTNTNSTSKTASMTINDQDESSAVQYNFILKSANGERENINRPSSDGSQLAKRARNNTRGPEDHNRPEKKMAMPLYHIVADHYNKLNAGHIAPTRSPSQPQKHNRRHVINHRQEQIEHQASGASRKRPQPL